MKTIHWDWLSSGLSDSRSERFEGLYVKIRQTVGDSDSKIFIRSGKTVLRVFDNFLSTREYFESTGRSTPLDRRMEITEDLSLPDDQIVIGNETNPNLFAIMLENYQF